MTLAEGATTNGLTLSASGISAYLSCPMKYAFRYERRLEARRSIAALERGTLIHQVAQAHWNSGGATTVAAQEKYDKILSDWYDKMRSRLLPGEFNEWLSDFQHTAALMHRYVNRYSPLPQDIVVVGEEIEVSAELVPGIRVVGFVDLVVTTDGELWAVEIKSARNIDRRLAWVKYDQQPVVYVALLRAMGMPVRGVTYDTVQTYPYAKLHEQPDEKLFKRADVVPSAGQIAELKRNVGLIARNIKRDQEGGFARNLGSTCSSCDFRAICHAEVEGDERLAKAYENTQYKVRLTRQEKEENEDGTEST